ncbi:MAG: DUF2177 family protein [Phenylobacterium sp.]
MLKYLAAYLATAVSFAAVDAVWLTQAGPRLYRPALDPILATQPALAPAAVFYLVYPAGILLFAVLPYRDRGFGKVGVRGALLGAFAYATYDLTNQATLKVWASGITLTDIAWGAVVTALGALAGLAAWRRAGRGRP